MFGDSIYLSLTIIILLFTTKIIDLESGQKSDDDSQSHALTPVSTSSFGHSVMSKRGKTEYDVQKNLSGLMLNSQPSAKTRQPFIPPGQKRQTEEESLDNDSLVDMYTALKARPRSLTSRAPPHFQRKATGAVPGHGRSKFKNPFKIRGQEVESKTKVEISRYVRQGVQVTCHDYTDGVLRLLIHVQYYIFVILVIAFEILLLAFVFIISHTILFSSGVDWLCITTCICGTLREMNIR